MPRIQGDAWLDTLGTRAGVVSAAQSGDTRRLEFFFDTMKGSVDVSDDGGRTLLSHAAEKGRASIVEFLLSRSTSVSVPDKQGRTAIYWAAKEGMETALKVLVQANAPITTTDVNISIQMGYQDISQYLARHLRT